MRPNFQSMMDMLKKINPQQYNDISSMRQNGTNPEPFTKQILSKMQPQEKQLLFQRAKMLGAPDSVLSYFQNMK